jgi:heme/copper-type cytochrome/quinol oxidase subunit 2
VTSADLLTLLTSGGYGIAALALTAVVYLYRAREADRTAAIASTQADHAAQIELLKTVVPLAEKLAEGVLSIERLATSVMRRENT